MKIVERGGGFSVVSSTDPTITLVTYPKRSLAEDFVRRRSTKVENLRFERKGQEPKTSTDDDGIKRPSWGYSGGRH